MKKNYWFSLRFLVALGFALAITGCNDDDDETPAAQASVALNATFEQLAVLPRAGIASLSLSDKSARLESVLNAVVIAAQNTAGVQVAYGAKSLGTVGNTPALLPFPVVDVNMDGVPDETGRMVELRFSGDEAFLANSLGLGIALPWPVAAYTDSAGDTIQIVAAVPETWTRTHLRGTPNLQTLINQAVQNRKVIEQVVQTALKPLGFEILNRPLPQGMDLGESQIAALETRFGQALTPDFVAPSVTLSGSFVNARDVATAIENVFLADQVPDLDGNGVAGEGSDDAVLPSAMMNFLGGRMSFEAFSGMMAQGPMVWGQGGSFQDWVVLRTVEVAGPNGTSMQVIELCQEFYAGTALGFGLHHMPVMPCAIGVWEDAQGVHVSILNTVFLFGYLFSDVQLDPNQPIAQIFSIFPAFVFNDLAGGVNAALAGLGLPQTERFALLPL
jgi:hypothetical protein